MTQIDKVFVGFNSSAIYRKTFRSYLGPPYGQCSDYSEDQRHHYFNADNHLQCYRRCLLIDIHKQFNCYLRFVNRTFSYSDNNSSIIFNNTHYCFSEVYLQIDVLGNTTDFNTKCLAKCPKDCQTVDYNFDIIESDSFVKNDFWMNKNENERQCEKRLVWNTNYPHFSYDESSVMSFEDFLKDFGGLMGLWFGLSANAIFVWIIHKKPWIIAIRISLEFVLLFKSITMRFIRYLKRIYSIIKNYIHYKLSLISNLF